LGSIADTPKPGDELIASLDLAQKVRLLTGATFWRTHAEAAVGLRSMLLSDGPAGVRGEHWDERQPSLNLPSPTALAATWDPRVAERYGSVLAAEARAKGVHVVLGPTINLHRSPLGGRHFEGFSEDPLLSGTLAVGFVRGLQRNGVAATPKHFVANDSETERFTVDVRVDERTLREVYLAPFELAVVEGGAWAVMSAYNSVNGITMTENDLLRDPLWTEWGFDGVVISDWTAVRSTEPSALAHQDLVMPGPGGPWGAALVEAVRQGRVPEAAIDEKVRRILRLASRVGAREASADLPQAPASEGFTREAAAAGMVLVRNRSELPWVPDALRSVAVSGQSAEAARIQGGGSATVVPDTVVSPLQGLRNALPTAEVRYGTGAVITDGPLPLPPRTLTNPATGESGVRARFLDSEGSEVLVEDRFATDLVWLDTAPAQARTLELRTRYRPEADGPANLAVACVGPCTVFVDGAAVLDTDLTDTRQEPSAGLFAPPSASVSVNFTAGAETELRVVHELATGADQIGPVALTFGFESTVEDSDAAIAQAVESARTAEVALVVVGTTARGETEGIDRTSLALPGRQDELVHAVAAANPRTVVVVNAGAPVLMPWRDEVAAILLTWFPGQDFGAALADVLLGMAEPGGRLPTSWPAQESDVPVLSTAPVNGVLDYAEGVHIGYRAWLKSGRAPAYPFGHGLGYTAWQLGELSTPPTVEPGEGLSATVRLANTGARGGKQVVQVYLSRLDSAVDRPIRWLAGFACAYVDAGETIDVAVDVAARAFAHWDGEWCFESGTFVLHAGTSSDDLPLSANVVLT
jgi:beta-glucosidase